jgi:hypothetical protein
MNATHHVMNHWTDRNHLRDGIDVLVLEAQLADKGELRVDGLLSQMPEVEIHHCAVGSLNGAALLLFANERLR